MKALVFVFILVIHLYNDVYAQSGICGTDDRVAYANKAIGRVGRSKDLGGTCFLTKQGKIITNQHVMEEFYALPPSERYIDFFVPPSEGNRTPTAPYYEYIFEVQGTIWGGSPMGLQDWAIITLKPNLWTGKSVWETMSTLPGEFLDVKNILPNSNSTLSIAGYGIDQSTANRTLQIASGSYYGFSNGYIYAGVDAAPCNSGSPIIDLTDGKVVGILSKAGPCESGNLGIAFYENTALWSGIEGNTLLLRVLQYNSSGQLFDVLEWWNSSEQQYNAVSNGGTIRAIKDNYEVLRAYKNINPNSEKFHKWMIGTDYWTNHLKFFVDSNMPLEVKAYLNISTGNSCIQYYGLELYTTLNDYSIKFRDPWLNDLNEAPYGIRNRGIDANFKERSSPFYPDYTTNYNGDVYKGVFLDQEISSNSPYYSVQAISPQTCTLAQTNREHTFYFQNWSANTVNGVPGAVFQNANSPTTGVVFKKEGAVVSANMKGTQLSSQSEAFKHNGQNKIVRISNGRMYQVYESMGNLGYKNDMLRKKVVIESGCDSNLCS